MDEYFTLVKREYDWRVIKGAEEYECDNIPSSEIYLVKVVKKRCQ